MKNACVIIPIYNQIPTESEVLSITRNISVLSEYDIFAVCPSSMNATNYNSFGFKHFLRFDDMFFKSNKTYSRLILSEDLYKPIINYEYMLIAQTDTYILNTEYTLQQFVNMGYEYYGAPWPDGPFDKPYGLREYFKSLFVPNSKKLRVGNGGFSLRRVDSCINAIKKHRLLIKYLWKFNEDLFFSTKLDNVCPADVAEKFALETNMQKMIDNGQYPFALHAFEKHLNDYTHTLSSFHSTH